MTHIRFRPFRLFENNLQHTDYKLLITNAEVAKKWRKDRIGKCKCHHWPDWVLESIGKIYPLRGCRDQHLHAAKSQTLPIKRLTQQCSTCVKIHIPENHNLIILYRQSQEEPQTMLSEGIWQQSMNVFFAMYAYIPPMVKPWFFE